jgi:FO synthase
MDESISRAAGASHGQQLDATRMRELITSHGRRPQQRTTLYADAPGSVGQLRRRVRPSAAVWIA